ncbi:MAG: hypothetical protein LBI02_03780 [Opitutaceae bacterium]|nr:hypothetical protein [Opitutaceae bacterium]
MPCAHCARCDRARRIAREALLRSWQAAERENAAARAERRAMASILLATLIALACITVASWGGAS